MKAYLVKASLKFPSCYNSGYEFEILAATKAEAIKRARGRVKDAGHTRQDGPLSYSAEEI